MRSVQLRTAVALLAVVSAASLGERLQQECHQLEFVKLLDPDLDSPNET